MGGIAPPLKLMFCPLAVTVVPHVVVGNGMAATARPAGKVATAPMIKGSFGALGVVKVMVNRAVPPTATVAGATPRVTAGGAAKPVPVNVTVLVGNIGSFELITMFAVLAPVATALKAMLSWQVANGAMTIGPPASGTPAAFEPNPQ